MKRFLGKRPALFKSGQWHFHQDNAPVHNSILVIDYLTKMGIKTVHQPPYSPDLSPCDFCLFLKLRGCRYETIEEMREAVTKVIDTLKQEDFHGAFQNLLERYNKCIAAGGLEFHVCTINKSAHTKKKSGNLFNDPRSLEILPGEVDDSDGWSESQGISYLQRDLTMMMMMRQLVCLCEATYKQCIFGFRFLDQ